MPLIPIFIILIVATLLIAYWFWRQLDKLSATGMIQDLTNPVPPGASYEIFSNNVLQEYYQSPMAQHSLAHELKLLSQKKIKAIYLVHGTFMGNDPFHIISLLEENVPDSAKSIFTKFKEHCKRTGDFFAKDLGNFTQEHIELMQGLIKDSMSIHNFTWSSANHHCARLMACLDLIESLNAKNFKTKDRILLIGHSHAGQVFALLTQIIHNKNLQNFFFEVLASFEIEVAKYLPMIKKLKHNKFDIITMGAPPRYSWKTTPNIKLLHIINHRGESVLGGSLKGFVTTKDGDYIQQWGVEGSDIISPIKKEQEINKLLDLKLGIGQNLDLFKQNILLRHRLHDHGHHYLIDYGDNSKVPNFIKTGFGHWGYTKIELLSFHFHLINRYLT